MAPKRKRKSEDEDTAKDWF